MDSLMRRSVRAWKPVRFGGFSPAGQVSCLESADGERIERRQRGPVAACRERTWASHPSGRARLRSPASMRMGSFRGHRWNPRKNRANYNRNGERVLKGYREIDLDDRQTFADAWLSEATRWPKESASMYIFLGWSHLKEMLTAIDESNLHTVNRLIGKHLFGVVAKRKYVTSRYHRLFVCTDDQKRSSIPAFALTKERRRPAEGLLAMRTRRTRGRSSSTWRRRISRAYRA